MSEITIHSTAMHTDAHTDESISPERIHVVVVSGEAHGQPIRAAVAMMDDGSEPDYDAPWEHDGAWCHQTASRELAEAVGAETEAWAALVSDEIRRAATDAVREPVST